MKYYNINIKIFSIGIIIILTIINAYFLYSTSQEHNKQKELVKDNLKNKAISQFDNIESLIRWSASIDNEKAQAFTMHQKDTDSGMMFALPYLEKKTKDSIYYFKLSSLKPINPKNTPDKFEERGLKHFLENRDIKYYEEYTNKDYNFIGRLNQDQSCVKCHTNSSIGDLRGGIRISVPLDTYNEQISNLDKEAKTELFLLIGLFLTSIFSLVIFTSIVNEKDRTIMNYNKNLEKEVQSRTIDLENTFEQTIHSFIKMVEARDSYTAGHSSRVQKYSNIIARHMKFDDEFVNRLDKASYLHDIGKLYTPDSVLLKPGKLSKTEYKLIQEHAIKGYETLINIDAYKNIAKIVGSHHERYDGSGYPYGLKGKEIPIESRIMAIADTFDAMTTNRIYRSRMNVKSALEEIASLKGKDFDPDIVDKAVEALSNVTIEKTSQLPTSGSEHQRLAYHFKDSLTELYNLSYLNILITMKFYNMHFLSLHIINLKNFHQYNKKHGWGKGNELLINFAKILENKFPDSFLFRVFGDDFIVLNEKENSFTEDTFKDCEILSINDIWVEIEYYDLRKKDQEEKIMEILSIHS